MPESEDDKYWQFMIGYLKEHPEKHMSGNDHQYSEAGVPIFNDGVAFKLSMRQWGQLMADVFNERYSSAYMKWAFSRPNEL